jgi:hypothetical protein
MASALEIAERALRKGLAIPEGVEAVLSIPEPLQPYWDAWDVLHAGRHYAAGMAGALPMGLAVSEMLAYAHAFGFAESDEDLAEFFDYMRAQDSGFFQAFSELHGAPGSDGGHAQKRLGSPEG